jgi:UDP-N-acetylglucosamine 2-epimerase (non-hydrolysing)/GDP/UDP-N,N'-diacetylbacillosamine 2-epimerase (hydrolysing)
MGEEPWRVHRAGAPSLDHLRRSQLLSRNQLEHDLSLDLQRPTAVVAYHPVTMLRDTTEEADALFAALRQMDMQILFCFPNSDAGSYSLMERTRSFISDYGNARIFVNLEAVTYWSLLRQVTLLVGNSSSGIMEAASLALPVVNVGFRQKGRERAGNVLDAAPEEKSIRARIEEARSTQFREGLAGLANPYGDGRASEKIVQVLTTTALSAELLVKRSGD